MLLNAWCEFWVEDLSGRCPHSRVSLPPDPEGKGADSSCLTWTPSSPHFTSSQTTSATPNRQEEGPLPKPPSPRARCLPWQSLPVGAVSTARGTSTATPTPSCGMHSLPCPTARSSTPFVLTPRLTNAENFSSSAAEDDKALIFHHFGEAPYVCDLARTVLTYGGFTLRPWTKIAGAIEDYIPFQTKVKIIVVGVACCLLPNSSL